MVKDVKEETLGQLFLRLPDIERCDLFIDPGFLDWERYTGKPVNLRDGLKKGPQILSSIPYGGQKKCALQAASGYFDPVFKSVSINIPYVENWKYLGRPKSHPIDGAWIPTGPSKKHSTPGDHHGTFTKLSEATAFSPLMRPALKSEKELKNFVTNPGKKGNCGYLDICINKYPPHTVHGIVDSYTEPALQYGKNWVEHKAKMRNGPLKAGFHPQPYFETNPFKDPKLGPTYIPPKVVPNKYKKNIFYPPATPKDPGNNHDGCFNKFPSWSPDPYVTQKEAVKMLSKRVKPGLVFRPEPRIKSYYTRSVVNNKIDIACNELTWRTMKPITYPQFNL